MEEVDDNSVDLVKTDPPYGISKEVKITRGRNKMKFKGPDISLDFGEWDNFKDEKEFWSFTFAWIDEIIRVLRPGGIFAIFFDRDKINFVSRYLQQKKFKFKDYFAFIKSNPVPQARKVKWQSGWEMGGIWQKPGGKLTYNYELGQQKNYIISPICSGKERYKHPTQKPEKVIIPFILYWSNEEDIVLDNFAGTGTTLALARRYKRRWIGYETNPKYYKIAVERVEREKTLWEK